MFAHVLTATGVLGFWFLFGVLVFHVPKYEAVFKSLNAKLPAATVLVLQVSVFLQSNWIIVLPIGTVAIIAGCLLAKGVSGTLGLVVSAAVCLLMGLGIWGCYAALNLVIRAVDRQLT